MFKKVICLVCCLALCACASEKEVIYKSVYPNLPQLESPLVLSTSPCKFSLPENPDSNIFIGFDKENFKCYLRNQELNREQKLLFEKFVDEVNKERKIWNDANKKLDNKK